MAVTKSVITIPISHIILSAIKDVRGVEGYKWAEQILTLF